MGKFDSTTYVVCPCVTDICAQASSNAIVLRRSTAHMASSCHYTFAGYIYPVLFAINCMLPGAAHGLC